MKTLKFIRENWIIIIIWILALVSYSFIYMSSRIEFDTLEVQEEPSISREKQVKVMIKVWFSEKEANYMINVCSQQNNPVWCVEIASSIAYHETKWGTEWVWRKHKNNLFWLMQYAYNSDWTRYQISKVYPNRMASFEDWVWRYNTWWYKNDCNEMITKSRYTTTDIEPRLESCVKVQWMFNT